jgi:hypothetical protein
VLAFASIGWQAQPMSPAAAPPAPPPPAAATADATAAFFAPPSKSTVPVLSLAIDPKGVQKLREAPRSYVPCELNEGGREAVAGAKPGVKLKGAAGSFRAIDDRPAFTVSSDKFRKDDTAPLLFHGLEKVHLNNSVQDESLLNEWLCAEVFRSAGYPVARVGHARVSLNDRDLGMYVVIEGFDRRFLARHFGGKSGGNLYDGGFCSDIGGDLERDEGKGKVTRADLHALVAACAEENAPSHWPELEKLLDIDMYLRFMALELICGHWDGYSQHCNNYRLYFVPGGKAVFLPHGMDQTFNDPGYGVLIEQPSESMVTNAVMRNPAWRAAYRKELSRLVEKFDPDALIAGVRGVQARLQPALKQISEERARNQAQGARELIARIRARARSLREQAARPEPKPLEFKPGEAVLIEKWTEAGEGDDAAHEDATVNGVVWKKLACGPSGRCVASWRSRVLLPRGRYTLEAEAKTEGVETLAEDRSPGMGAGVRISGSGRNGGLTGTVQKTLRFEFSVETQTEVVLVLELRAAKGSVAYRADSLKLTRAADAAATVTR